MPRVPGQIERKRRSKKDKEEEVNTAAVVTLVEQIVPPMYVTRPDMAEKYLRKAQSEGIRGPFSLRHGAPTNYVGTPSATYSAQSGATASLGASRVGAATSGVVANGITPVATHSLFSSTSRAAASGNAGFGSRRT